MKYTAEDLRRCIGEPNYSRGLTYYHSGKVISFESEYEDELSGLVEGSGRNIYTQSISVTWRRNTLSSVDGDCSCPVGWNCKHVAAVALAAMETATTEPQIRLGHETENWIQKLKLTSKEKAPVSEAKVQYDVFYILVYEWGYFNIKMVKVAKKKGGGYSTTTKSYEYHHWIRRNEPPKFMTETDQRICRQMYFLEINDPYSNPLKSLGTEMASLLEEIVSTGRARWGTYEGTGLEMTSGWSCHLSWQDKPDGNQKLHLVGQGGTVLEVLPTEPLLAVDPVSGQVGYVDIDLQTDFVLFAVSGPSIAPAEASMVSEAMARAGVAKTVPLPTKLHRKSVSNLEPRPHLTLVGVPGHRLASVGQSSGHYSRKKWISDVLPVCRLSFQYGDYIAPIYPTDNLAKRQGDTVLTIHRNIKQEEDFLKVLLKLKLARINQIDHLRIDQEHGTIGDTSFWNGYQTQYNSAEIDIPARVLEFTTLQVPQLRQQGWQVDIDPSWPLVLHEGPYEMQGGVSTDDNGWFAFGLSVVVDGHKVDILPIVTSVVALLPTMSDGYLPADFDLDAFLSEQQFFLPLPDDKLLPVPGGKLKPLVEAFLAVYGLGESFHPAEAGAVYRAAQALEGSGIVFEGGTALRELGARLHRLSDIETEVALPAGLNAEMRPYQKIGYGWLRDLGETGFSGLLADDMGLGKTLQTLALLAKRHLEDKCEHPSLLIVPTSLLGNWRREAKKFTPELKILILHGQDRETEFGKINENHLIMTTYPLLHRDHATLFAQTYDLAILDEAQVVKNPAATVSKRIREITARQRVALTGTPIENSLEELWSIFDWLIPGLLGNRKVFRVKLRTPIEKHGSLQARAILNGRVAPFLLRRTKGQVAADLPQKTETTMLIPLSDGQKGLYEPIRAAMDKRVRDAIATKGINASRITILDALLKLRQVCCDPALVKLEAAKKVTESAKRTRMMEMLSELMAEGRKVLIFSQFVKMLKLIETDVVTQGWPYAILTGSTKDRELEVEKFQSGPASIFLISLKAGGVGLNLTAADTVIIYDPWWNPAVENQAIDRAHRIGQDKPVFVYRLVAEGTVEGAILKMQDRKRALADGVLKDGNDGPIGMSQDDLSALFRPLSS